MRAYRKTEDRYELKIDSGRLALLGVGAALVLALVFLLGVLVGKALWGAKRPISLPVEDVAKPPPGTSLDAEAESRPKLTFYEDLKKPDTRGSEPVVPSQPSSRAAEPRNPDERSAAAGSGEDPSRAPSPARESPGDKAREEKPEAAPRLSAPVFTVQVGSFRDRGSADDLSRQVAVHDASVQVVQIDVAGRTWYRVQVGRFETRSAAEAHYRSRLKPKGVQGFVTTR